MSLKRLKNLKDNKIGKFSYLKYGLGEIFLVVIGILIAVQINNLNEEYKEKKVKKMEKSSLIGEILAKRAKEKNIIKVYFDRGSYKYHGRIKSFADSLRKNGLEF